MRSKKIRSESISKPIKIKKNDNSHTAQEWHSIFNTINAAIWILNENQRILLSNKTAEIYFKRKLDEIIGKQCWEVVHGTAEPVPECPILRARVSLKRETMQLRTGKRWYEVTVDPILDNDGEFAGAVHIVTDVTNQKLTEEQLVASRDFAENLIQTANTTIIGLNIKGDITVFNKAAEIITEYKRAELEGRNWFETLVPKDRYPEVWKEFNRLKGGRIPVEFENPILTKSGKERFILWKNNVIREKGKITGTISFGLDITDRKNIEESLKIEHSQLFSIFDGVKEPIYVADMDTWEVLFVNHSLKTILGKNPVGGKCYRELQGFESPCPFCTNEIIKKSKPESYRWEHYNPIINRTFDLHDKVIRWPDGRDVRLELAIDITERKQAEIRLKKLNRIYSLLSNVNQMIVRVRDPLELFNETCRIAVEQGGFRMVWIGLLDPGTKQVNPVAHAGTINGYLKKINIILDNSNRGKVPTAKALKSGKYVVVNDIATDPGMTPWRDEAIKLGYRSFAAFPIIVSGEIHGTLNMYAPDPDFFDEEEQKLLEEMTSDIAFSLEFFEHEEKRKHAEKALRESEEKYRTIFEGAVEGFFQTTPEGQYKSVNPAIARMLGYDSPEQLIKEVNDLSKQQYVIPDDRQRYKKTLAEDNVIRGFETQLYRRDRNIIWVQINARTVKDAEGNLLYYEGTIENITERKLAIDKLRHSEAFLSNIIDQNPYGYWISDANGTLIRINQACCELLNISESDVVGRYNVLKDTIVKEQGMMPLVQNVFSEGETVRFEINYDTSKLKNINLKRHTSVMLDTTIFPIKDSNGRVINAVVQHVDITRRKQTENELQKYHEHLEELVKERTIKLEKANIELQLEINEREKVEAQLAKERNMLKTLIDNIPDEIYAKDKESRFIMANSHVIKSLWKNSLDEIINKTDFDVLPHDQASSYYNDEQSLMNSDKLLINYETSKYDNNGILHWYSITKVPLKDSENKTTGLVGINRDITMFKLAEESHKRAREAAEAANIAKSTFLSSMSHEIRTPLNAVLGFSQLMLNDENLTTDQKDYLETINRSGEHLLNLINDILEISKIEAGRAVFNPSLFDLHLLINDIETMFRIKADEKHLSLLVEYSEDLPKYIITDEGKLRQILINIVGNAVKFTEEGGVAARIRMDDIENGKGLLVIEVEDTGPGIDEKEIQKLFQMFGQTESGLKEGGTGLGLVISREYARMMNGDITVKSELNTGSCFTIIILAEKNIESSPVGKAPKKKIIGLEPGEKFRVLIVDDQADNRVLLNKILTSVGFEINEAGDGNEAVEKYKSWSPDIVIMDMRMPVMDGYEATRKIKSMDEKIPIIAVTASAFYEDRVKAIEAGADKYLRKPFKGHELLEHIKTHLGVKYIYDEEK